MWRNFHPFHLVLAHAERKTKHRHAKAIKGDLSAATRSPQLGFLERIGFGTTYQLIDSFGFVLRQ